MFWLLVWACISIHLIPRFDSNVNSACQERWYLKILARARQVESRRLSIANNSCPFYTVSPFFPLFLLFFYFLGVGVWCGCIYTLAICFIANASREVALPSTIQLTCIRAGQWCFKPDYSFRQIRMSIHSASSVGYLPLLAGIKPRYQNIFLATSISLTEAGCQCWMDIFHPSLHC